VDAAREGVETIARAAQNAGLGMPGGLYVLVNGTSVRVNPIFGRDQAGYGGSDELWMVVADSHSFRRCQDSPGGSTIILSPGAGALSVSCIQSFTDGDTLVATNWTTGALLTQTTFNAGPPVLINYAESSALGFSDDPNNGGYKTQDVVFRVRVMHFFIQPNPANGGRPALYMGLGQPAASLAAGPFADASAQVVQDNVEDLQVAYDRNGAYHDGLDFNWTVPLNPADTLTSLRVTVVATTRFQQKLGSTNANRPYHPMKAENHDPGTAVDGYERVRYTRRLELPNLNPSNL
jgi:hypothetical protein